MLNALDFALAEPQEVAIIGNIEAEDTHAMRDALDRRYLPNTVVALAEPGDATAAQTIPLLRDRPQRDGRATAYVCRSFTCQAPTTEVEQMLRDLEERT
jgi:uncharacterized protein YyaL (SSP411 family)